MMTLWLWIVAASMVAVLAAAGLLHLLPHLGHPGRTVSKALCCAPALDGVMTWFIVLPLVGGALTAGWAGIGGGIVGQLLALLIWMALHEWAHRHVRRGPRIVKVLNRLVGTWRNHLALWVMVPAVPVFWLARLAQITIYPALTWLVGLPRYRAGEWVNVSRHKFEGLIGHDLIWCLYCDWMTGVWSLGSEMLRNIESLWCPIRFAADKKCKHCQLDFPDVAATDERPGWVPANATMADVAALLEQQYGQTTERSWYGHPTRLTIEGHEVGEQDRASLEKGSD